jgi:hypothetical protein
MTYRALIGFRTNDEAPRAEREGPRVLLQTFRAFHEYWFSALRKRGFPFLLLSCPPLATSDAKEWNPVLRELEGDGLSLSHTGQRTRSSMLEAVNAARNKEWNFEFHIYVYLPREKPPENLNPLYQAGYHTTPSSLRRPQSGSGVFLKKIAAAFRIPPGPELRRRGFMLPQARKSKLGLALEANGAAHTCQIPGEE